MNNKKSNLLLYGIIIGGLLGAGAAVCLSSRLISKNRKKKRDRKHKFYEGIDDIFDSKPGDEENEDASINKETEEGIIDELFSRTN
jgi:gas vesicle protein